MDLPIQPLKPKPQRFKRVHLACDTCRRKRIRCDGTRPVCTTCQQRNSDCEYQSRENNRKPPSKRYVESLHARIRVLEQQLISIGGSIGQSWSPENQEHWGQKSDHASGESGAEDEGAESAERDLSEEMSQLYGRLSLDEHGQIRYFSAQSNYHLLAGQMHSGQSQILQRVQQQGQAALSRLGKKTDVSAELQEHLLELYFRWQNPWVYLVHKEYFMRDFRRGQGPFCTPLLLNAIFAIAARYSDRIELRSDPADSNTAGEAFAEQARILLMFECEAATVTTTQATALLALRWMAENKEPAGWIYMGMAIRMAFNIGLHLDSSKWVESGLITTEEEEVRRVAWWGCYTLDKLFTLGLGRPSAIRECDITCPSPSLDTAAEFEPWVPMGPKDEQLRGSQSRVASHAHYAVEHLRIVTQALDLLYAPRSSLSKGEMEDLISNLDVALNSFWTCLPGHLRLPSAAGVPTLPHIYQIHFQYHVTQILLHRPLLARKKELQTAGSELGYVAIRRRRLLEFYDSITTTTASACLPADLFATLYSQQQSTSSMHHRQTLPSSASASTVSKCVSGPSRRWASPGHGAIEACVPSSFWRASGSNPPR
ncbi:fungal-specific transcription factor domain-containing protein [Stachybotrys elegans]|uniref:Fungal-specific transcription factor domain-containing protein n=1 Tax=Stachybotrys elegans TaxID=80388 RepID=A0A8K0WKV6_9HYPO|nr:fungal-specific transcription factor domain-containing protein [Stachybotrys elegans]